MCITISKSVLDCTHIGVWDIDHPEYGYRHVLAYQNRVRNLSEEPNCMLLHIPSRAAIKPEHLIDTTGHVDLLTELYEYLDPAPENTMMWMGDEPAKDRPNYVVEMGVYHIAILNHLTADGLASALSQIPQHKIPEIGNDFIDFFNSHFPGFPLLLCCFDTTEAAQAAPVMVHYAPLFPDKLMANTLDAHGGLPKIDRLLDFHQNIIFGTCKEPKGDNPYAKQIPGDFHPELAGFLPDTVSVLDLTPFASINLPNKDICIDLKSVQAGDPPTVTMELLGSKEQVHKTDIYATGNVYGIGDILPRR